jgi:regulator of sigma D
MEENMKLIKLKKAKIVKIDKQLLLEFSGEVIKYLSTSDLDSLSFTIEKGTIIVWKQFEIDIPEVIYSELSDLFKGNDEIISKWLQTPKAFLVNEAPIDMLKTERDIAAILDLINRIKTGDLS